MTDVVIRRCRQTDLAALADILVRVHARDGYPVEGVDDPESWITPPSELAAWTAVHGAEIIGHISLTRAHHTDDAAILWQRATGGDLSQLAIPVRLFVDPRHRNLGAGSLLLRAARRFADEHHLAMAFDVMLKDRDAIRLYENAGCQRLGTIVHEHSGGKTQPAAVYLVPHNPLPG